MLSLRINNADHLEITSNNTLSITLANPAFDTERIARNYSYPQRLSLTPQNREALNHQHRLDTRTRLDEVPAEVLLDDQLFDRGRALIKQHTDKATNLVFQNDDLSQITGLSEIKIRDLLGTIEIPQIESTLYVLRPGNGPNYLLTINDVLYTGGGLGVTVTDAMNQLANNINSDYPNIAQYYAGPDEFILTTDEETFGISFVENSFTLLTEQTLSDAREINLQNYVTTASAGNEPVAFPVVYAPQFYPRNFRWRFYLNHRIDGNYLTNGYDTEFGWATTYVPFVRLRYILDQIANAAGIDSIVFDLPTEQAADLDSLLIYNNVTLDQLRLENSVQFGEKEKNGFKTSITLANHVPDYTATELLQRISGYFNLNLRFERGVLHLRPNLRQVVEPAKDWTTITDPGYERTTTAGGGVIMTFEEDTDTPWVPTHSDYVVGDGTNTHLLPARPLHDRSTLLFESNNEGWKTAAIEGQTGTSEPLDLETENLTLRLFYDRGQQNNQEGRPYWMGSSGITDYDDNIIGDVDLALDGDNGIYTTFWRGWTQLLFSPTITRVTSLTIDQLIELKQWISTKVYIYHPEGAALAVVEKVQFKVSTKGIGKAKIEYRKFEP